MTWRERRSWHPAVLPRAQQTQYSWPESRRSPCLAAAEQPC